LLSCIRNVLRPRLPTYTSGKGCLENGGDTGIGHQGCRADNGLSVLPGLFGYLDPAGEQKVRRATDVLADSER